MGIVYLRKCPKDGKRELRNKTCIVMRMRVAMMVMGMVVGGGVMIRMTVRMGMVLVGMRNFVRVLVRVLMAMFVAMPMAMPMIVAVMMMTKCRHAYKVYCQAKAADNEQLGEPLSFSTFNDPFESLDHDLHANESVHVISNSGLKQAGGKGHLH